MNRQRLGRPVMFWARRTVLGRNLLRRRTDRIEGWSVVVAVLLVLVMVPVALAVGTATQRHAAALAVAQAADRHQVVAVLTGDVPAATDADQATTVAAPARWRLPDGTEHTGTVAAPAGTTAGTHLPIWVDRHGQPVEPPLTTGQAGLQGILAGFGVLGGTAAVTLAALVTVRRRLDHTRLTAWAAEWRQVSPRWSRRHTQ